MFWNYFCIGLFCLPIPVGILWVIIYRDRKSIGLPDWFSGILAQGIISGHKIDTGKADENDYAFIIIAVIVIALIFACVMTVFTG